MASLILKLKARSSVAQALISSPIIIGGTLPSSIAVMSTNTPPPAEFRPPVPPFTLETALQKVKAAEDAWNSMDPDRVSKAYTINTEWRNRTEFITGRDAVKEFLTKKWKKELNYRLMKELWCYQGNRISVRFEYEWQDDEKQWYRTHGNEHWEFDDNGLMRRRDMSANDIPIHEAERRYR